MIVGFLFLSPVLSHAVMTYPQPFNPNPSRTSLCGGANFVPGLTPVLNLTAGESLPIFWHVIAGDGSGTVTASVTFNSTRDYATTDLNMAANSVGRFKQNLTVPYVPCSNSSNPCIMNVKTTSNWFSCFAFTIGNLDTPPPRPSTPPCVRAPNTLQFCSSLRNLYVSLPASNSVPIQDSIEQSYYDSIVFNQNVLTNGSNSDCRGLLTGYLCLSSMPFCGESSSLTTETVGMNECYCEKMKQTCGVTESHWPLFNCSNLVRCGQTSSEIRRKWSAWWITGLLLLF